MTRPRTTSLRSSPTTSPRPRPTGRHNIITSPAPAASPSTKLGTGTLVPTGDNTNTGATQIDCGALFGAGATLAPGTIPLTGELVLLDGSVLEFELGTASDLISSAPYLAEDQG